MAPSAMRRTRSAPNMGEEDNLGLGEEDLKEQNKFEHR